MNSQPSLGRRRMAPSLALSTSMIVKTQTANQTTPRSSSSLITAEVWATGRSCHWSARVVLPGPFVHRSSAFPTI